MYRRTVQLTSALMCIPFVPVTCLATGTLVLSTQRCVTPPGLMLPHSLTGVLSQGASLSSSNSSISGSKTSNWHQKLCVFWEDHPSDYDTVLHPCSSASHPLNHSLLCAYNETTSSLKGFHAPDSGEVATALACSTLIPPISTTPFATRQSDDFISSELT